MNLAEKMKRYKTVNRPRCAKCANPWFFEINPNRHECTTCGYVEFDELEAARKRDEENERARRRREDEAAAVPTFTPSPSFDSSPSFDPPASSNDSGWSGDGGGFSGGGASGEW